MGREEWGRRNVEERIRGKNGKGGMGREEWGHNCQIISVPAMDAL